MSFAWLDPSQKVGNPSWSKCILLVATLTVSMNQQTTRQEFRWLEVMLLDRGGKRNCYRSAIFRPLLTFPADIA